LASSAAAGSGWPQKVAKSEPFKNEGSETKKPGSPAGFFMPEINAAKAAKNHPQKSPHEAGFFNKSARNQFWNFGGGLVLSGEEA
jgi:hypothetical protein